MYDYITFIFTIITDMTIHLETISSYLRIYYFYVFHIAHMK